MLPNTDNERLTRVGPGTPMGELMRRCWHPIAAATQMDMWAWYSQGPIADRTTEALGAARSR